MFALFYQLNSSQYHFIVDELSYLIEFQKQCLFSRPRDGYLLDILLLVLSSNTRIDWQCSRRIHVDDKMLPTTDRRSTTFRGVFQKSPSTTSAEITITVRLHTLIPCNRTAWLVNIVCPSPAEHFTTIFKTTGQVLLFPSAFYLLQLLLPVSSSSSELFKRLKMRRPLGVT